MKEESSQEEETRLVTTTEAKETTQTQDDPVEDADTDTQPIISETSPVGTNSVLEQLPQTTAPPAEDKNESDSQDKTEIQDNPSDTQGQV